MGRNHMKRLAAPRSWPIERKLTKYVTRPMPGAHSYNLGMPLNIIIKEILKLANNSREVKEIIKNGVFVDGKRIFDERYIVGFMDVLVFGKTNESYRILLNKNGFVTPVKIDEKETKVKLTKIIGKTLVKGKNGKIQLNLNDGRNILTENLVGKESYNKESYKRGDVLLLEIPSQKILEKIPIEKGVKIYLMGGKHIGEIHTAENITGEKIALRSKEGQVFETLRKYAFAVGKDKPLLESVQVLAK